jgi:hypothetical protein
VFYPQHILDEYYNAGMDISKMNIAEDIHDNSRGLGNYNTWLANDEGLTIIQYSFSQGFNEEEQNKASFRTFY